MYTVDNALVEKWEPVLDGIKEDYTKRVTAQLLENQAKTIIAERLDEAGAPTTVGKLGAFQKFAFPLVRRVYPKLIANNICGVQPMQGPVSQIFYLGHSRDYGGTEQSIYSKYQLTYRGFVTSGVFNAANIDLDVSGIASLGSGDPAAPDTSGILTTGSGAPSTTFGGQIAAFPDSTKIWGVNVSAGENLTGTGIPEINFHIEQQPVVARTRKMRALWTLEAAQDLRAYHNMDLERELTDLLGKELQLEIDRELIEDLRMIAYDVTGSFGGFNRTMLDSGGSNNFPTDGDGMIPADWQYEFTSATNPAGGDRNVFLVDFTSSALFGGAQHVGHVYANLLAAINLASQDIYKTTMRGPGTWLVCAPIVASLLESAAKLEGGIASSDGPSNMGGNIEYKGKFAGKYDLYIDPLYPEDEILMGYKGANAMDAGYVYAPYIPLQQLPTIVDPDTFQPRKGILTRYGKAAITPESRFYRIIRIVGPISNFLFQPFGLNTATVPG